MSARLHAVLRRERDRTSPSVHLAVERRSDPMAPKPSRADRDFGAKTWSCVTDAASVTTRRAERLESILEADLFALADADPQVTDVETQVRLPHSGKDKFVDFRLTLSRADGTVVGVIGIEVKPDDVAERTGFDDDVRAMERAMPVGWADRILRFGESDIRSGPLLANAKRIAWARACLPPKALVADVSNFVPSNRPVRLSEIVDAFDDPLAVEAVMVLVGRGLLRPAKRTPSLDLDPFLFRGTPDQPSSAVSLQLGRFL